MPQVNSYRDLDVWQQSMNVVEQVYRLSKGFPSDERFGLTSQLRRAAVSIPANIAEGHGRSSRQDYSRHLFISRGSLAELETELMISVKLGYISRESIQPVWKDCQTTGKLLGALIRSLR